MWPIPLHATIPKGKECEITTQTHILARMKFGSPLADNDIPSPDQLAAIALYAKPLRIAITAIPRCPLTLFMCHNFLSLNAFNPDDRLLLAMAMLPMGALPP